MPRLPGRYSSPDASAGSSADQSTDLFADAWTEPSADLSADPAADVSPDPYAAFIGGGADGGAVHRDDSDASGAYDDEWDDLD